jgi:hypothetical protein
MVQRTNDPGPQGGRTMVRRYIQKFPDWVDNEINNNNKHMLRWIQRVMAAKLTILTHKIAIQQLHLVANSCTICSSRSRWPVRRLLDTRSYSHCTRYCLIPDANQTNMSNKGQTEILCSKHASHHWASTYAKTANWNTAVGRITAEPQIHDLGSFLGLKVFSSCPEPSYLRCLEVTKPEPRSRIKIVYRLPKLEIWRHIPTENTCFANAFFFILDTLLALISNYCRQKSIFFSKLT